MLPTLIPQATTAAVAPTSGRRVRVWSRELSAGRRCASSTSATKRPAQGWLDYVQGVTRGPASARAFESAASTSRWPRTCRSAAACRRARRSRCACCARCGGCSASTFDDVRLAQIGRARRDRLRRRARRHHGPDGVEPGRTRARRCSSTRGRSTTEPVPLPPGTELVVINSGVAHHHAHGDYRTRRAECERAATLLGVAELRDVGVGRSAAARGAAGAARSARASRRHREPAGARRGGGDARRRRGGARRAVQRVARQPARRLRVLGAGGRPAGRDRASRARRATARG